MFVLSDAAERAAEGERKGSFAGVEAAVREWKKRKSTVEDTLEAVRGLRAAEPDLEPLLAKLREQRPDLEAATKASGRWSSSRAGPAAGEPVIKRPSPLSVCKDTYDRGCHRASSDEYQHVMVDSALGRGQAVREALTALKAESEDLPVAARAKPKPSPQSGRPRGSQ